MSWKGSSSQSYGSKGSKGGSAWGGEAWNQQTSSDSNWKDSWKSNGQDSGGKSWGQASESWGQSGSQGQVVRPPAKKQADSQDQGWKRPSTNSWEQEPAWKKPATDGKGKSKGESKGSHGSYGKGEDSKGGSAGNSKGDAKGAAKGGYGAESKGGYGSKSSYGADAKGYKGSYGADSKGSYGAESKGSYGADSKGGKSSYGADSKGGKGYGGKSADPVATFKGKVDFQTKEYDSVEKVTNSTLEVAKRTLQNEKATAGAIKSQIDSLDRMAKKASETQDAIYKDCEEAKNGGAAAKGFHTELSKLLAKAKGLGQQIRQVNDKLKPRLSKAQYEQDIGAKEAKDAAAFRPLLAKASQTVASAEGAVSIVTKKAAPVIESPPEGDELTEVATSIETAAQEALKKVDAAKGDLQEKFKIIQQYAPEAKKTSNVSLQELQRKLADMANQMRLYQAFKKELPKLLEAKKTIDEAIEKFDSHEAEVEKASKLADPSKLSKEDAKQIDEIFRAVLEAITASTKLAHQMKAVATSKDKLTKLQTRGEDLKKKINSINAKIKKQKDVFVAENVNEDGQEKLKKVEEGVTACQTAEMPYLTGVEVLPDDEEEQVLKECNAATEAATSALKDAKAWFHEKLAEAKNMEKELGEKMTVEVKELMAKMNKPEASLTKFKKDMANRKTAKLMSSTVGAVKELEQKVTSMEGECKALKAASLEEESDESLKDAVEKTRKVVTEVHSSLLDTRKLLQTKQKEAKAQAADAAVKAVNDRWEAANTKVKAFQQAIVTAEKIIKARAAVTSGEEKVKELEAEVEKAQKLVPAKGEKLAFESVAILDEIWKSVSELERGIYGPLSSAIKEAPAKAKSQLQDLMSRKDQAHKASDKVWTDTKDVREEAMCDSYVAEAEVNIKAVEAASASVEEAEKPFLIGGTLSLKEKQEAIAKCEEGVTALKKAISAAQKYAEAKMWEAKKFGEASSKKLKEAFDGMGERRKKMNQKLATYDKDLKERILGALMGEAQEKVDALEAEVKTTVGLAEPFTKEGGDKMSEEEAAEPLKAFMEADAAINEKIASAKHFLASREKDEKAKQENMNILKTLKERVGKVQEELATVKKATAPFEKRSLGKRLVAEATELVGGLEAEVKKAKDKCAPLIEKEGVEFLVGNSNKSMVSALSAHMKAKELTVEDLFKEANKGKAMNEKTFVKYVAGLPEAIGAESLSCINDERRVAMFKKLTAGGKSLDEATFKSMFEKRFYCGDQTVLSSEESPESESICKVEKNEIVILVGEEKDVGSGLKRQQCKFGDKTGWVTTSTAKGRIRFQFYNEYRDFCFAADGVVLESGRALDKVVNNVTSKLKQCSGSEDDTLKDAKEKLTKLKEDAHAVQKSFEEFRKAFGAAKREFQNKEKAEMNAHIEAKNAKEAAPYVEGPKSKVEAVEAAAAAAEAACAPMATLAGDELLAFTTPSVVSSAVEKSVAEANEKMPEAREAIKEQQKALAEIKPATGGTAEATKQLKALSSRIDAALKKIAKVSATLKKQCRTLIEPKLESVAEALRKHAVEKGVSGEGLFDSLKDGEKIPEAAFCSLVASLEGASCNADIAKLIAQNLEADGISKDAFIKFVVIYYKVVKGIAFTDERDISKCKTLRKAEVGEVLEALGSPVTDEGNGMSRLKCKALREPPCEGWVTLSGNQGTCFLEKTTKP